MRTYQGSHEVEPGLYFNAKTFSITSIESREPLPGTKDDTYRAVPMPVMLAAAPLLGLAYVIFLPFIGFAMVAWLLGDKAVMMATGAATHAGRVVRPGWAPALAFLSRSKPAEPDTHLDSAPDAWSAEAERKANETDGRG
jgi:hypothetical protein